MNDEYNVLVGKIKKAYLNAQTDSTKAVLEDILPELRESEDERIRKGLLKMFNHYVRNNIELNEYDLDKDMVLAWLEKQGESDETKAKMFLMNKGYPIDANGTFPTYDEIYNIIRDELKSLKERYTWKPSDEQIVALEHFVRSIGESGYASPYDNNTKLLYSLLNNLKKLRKK